MSQWIKYLTAASRVTSEGVSLIHSPEHWVKGSGVSIAAWVTDAAQIQSLAQELSYAMGAAINFFFFILDYILPRFFFCTE